MKSKRKVSKYNSSIRNPAKHIISFEGWDKMSGQQFHREKLFAKQFYHVEVKPQDLQDDVYKWMVTNGYSKKDVTAVRNHPTGIFPSMGQIVRLLKGGCPDFNIKEQEYWSNCRGTAGSIQPLTQILKDHIDSVLQDCQQEPEVEAETITTAPTVSIQERMFEQVAELLGEIEQAIDQFIDGKLTVKSFDPYKMMQTFEPTIKAAHAKIIKKAFASMLQEAHDVVAWSDEDIKFAYSDYTAKKRKDFLAMYTKIDDACNNIIAVGTNTRKKRQPKAQSKERLVTKLNYKVSEPSLNIVSVNPIDIVGSGEVWVFNTRTRKLGRYVADPATGPITVKGSSLVGWDQYKSVQKTVRNSEVTLKEFVKANKTSARKFLTTIKSKESPLSGRISKETVILRVL